MDLFGNFYDTRTTLDLAKVLRTLRRREARQRSGSELTYRELAAKTGWSYTVIGKYFTGGALPPTDRFDELVRILGASPTEQGVLATERDRVEENRRWTAANITWLPRQLPADLPDFVGRTTELAELNRMLTTGPPHGPSRIVAMSGLAGVGKTALTVHWAHRVAEDFRDGQLYVDLRGFAPGDAPARPGEVVRGFLNALGVQPDRIPLEPAAQTGLYRSLLADKRVLIVLDNARDADQVRPLLPGSLGCLVVVTSRDRLYGLTAIEGARPLTLDLPTAAEARDLLVSRLGTGSALAEPGALRDILERCASLPLALSIVASRAASHPGFTLTALAAELTEACDGLDAFAGLDGACDLRAALSWSYRTLTAEAARLFRLLGRSFESFVTPKDTAGLAFVPLRTARSLLAELTRVNLLIERVPGRYTFHDLHRAYARELARGAE
ncbi:helix-turn-helix domain-containing protein [Actinophytocola sp.]|uniref:helix-turn-helix domain-containing protein n=1 Tax=Actinophytocola sp. TaxID=1872138 RepID=UPI003D6B559F